MYYCCWRECSATRKNGFIDHCPLSKHVSIRYIMGLYAAAAVTVSRYLLLGVAHLAKVYFRRYGGAAVYNPRRIEYFYCRTHAAFFVSVRRLRESACFNIILQDVCNIIYFYNTSIFYIIYYRIIYCSFTYAMCVYTTIRARGGVG